MQNLGEVRKVRRETELVRKCMSVIELEKAQVRKLTVEVGHKVACSKYRWAKAA